MSNNQQKTRPNDLTNTLGDLQPNVVGFTIEARDLEKMAMEYLQASGFKPLKSKVVTKDAGRGDLVLRQFIFFDRNDPSISRGNGNQKGGSNAVRLNPALERRMPTSDTRMNQQLFQALSSVALPENRTRAIPAKGGLVVVEVDPILVTGFLLDAELGVHRIIITNVLQKRDTILIDVFKRLEENSFDPGASVDRFTSALRSIR